MKLDVVLRRAQVVMATTGAKKLIPVEQVRRGQSIFALSNPEPEIEAARALEARAAVAAHGKSINNILASLGLFFAALRARAARFSDAMLLAAARAIAAAALPVQLAPNRLNGQRCTKNSQWRLPPPSRRVDSARSRGGEK